jgi:hypothetical protein
MEWVMFGPIFNTVTHVTLQGRNGMEWVMNKIKEEDSNKVPAQSSPDILTQIESKFIKEAEDLKINMDHFLKNAQATGSPL